MKLFNKIIFEFRKDKEFYFLILFSIAAILIGLNYVLVFNYIQFVLCNSFSSKCIDIFVALLTTQLPLCVFILGKNDGKLKYNFIKSDFLRKTKTVYIVITLLLLMILTVIFGNNHTWLFLCLIFVIILIIFIIKQYINITKDIMCVDDESFIDEIFDKVLYKINQKVLSSTEINEIITFCVEASNLEYSRLFYNKIIKCNSDFSSEFVARILRNFEKRYKNIMDYAQENALNVSFNCSDTIENSESMIRIINMLRSISLINNKMVELSLIIDYTVQYLINVLKYYFDNNICNKYWYEIDKFQNYFEVTMVMPLKFDRFYDLFLFGISKYIYSSSTIFKNYQVDKSFINIINSISECISISCGDKSKENLYAIFYFYISQIELVIGLKNVSIDIKRNMIKNVIKCIKEIVRLNDFDLYLSFVSNMYNQNLANKFSILYEDGIVECEYDINIFDLMYCCYFWVHNNIGTMTIVNDEKNINSYNTIFSFFKQTKENSKKLQSMMMLDLINDDGIILLSKCINNAKV